MTDLDRRCRTYSFVSLGIVAVVAISLFGATTYFNPNRSFRNTVQSLSSPDYLANLRGRTEFGCRSFLEKRPDVLFIGDSHTYAAFRFGILSEALAVNISACALGGFYMESFALLADLMSRANYVPRIIVLGASPRAFVEGRDKASALATHKFYLSESYTVRDFVQDLATGQVGRMVAEASLTNDEENETLARHRGRIEAVSPGSATEYIAFNPNSSVTAWINWSRYAESTRNVDEIVGSICAYIKRRKILLYVIDIPESPFLRNRIYSDAILRDYRKNLAYFHSCTDHVIAEPASYYGLDDRHYFNRHMLDDFDYAKIASSEKINVVQSGRDVDYDLDHMNLVGADLFTRRLLPVFKSIEVRH